MPVNSAVTFFEWFLPYVLTCLGCVLTILITILLKKIGKIDDLAVAFQQHLLNWTKLLGELVTKNDCSGTRINCVELNKTIIQKPLQKQLDDYIKDSDESWRRYEDEYEQVWVALHNHIHTESGVVSGGPRKIKK